MIFQCIEIYILEIIIESQETIEDIDFNPINLLQGVVDPDENSNTQFMEDLRLATKFLEKRQNMKYNAII